MANSTHPDRRTFVQLSTMAVSLAVASCTTSRLKWPADSPGPAKVIDAHCHIFSGKDVPASDFVLHTVAREIGFEQYADIVAFFVRLVLLFAPSAEREIDTLTGSGSRAVSITGPAVDAEKDQDFETFILRTLQELRNNATSGARLSGSGDFDEQVLRNMERAGWPSQSQLRVSGGLNLDARALQTLKEIYLPPAAQSRSAIAQPGDTDTDLRTISRRLAADAASPMSAIGSYLKFARAFVSFRSTNLKELHRQLRLSSASRTCLYTPSLVDYDWWLDAQGKTTSLETQTRLMALISAKTEPGVLMNGFVPFDPLRAALERRGNPQADILQTVRVAVHERGFVGVKVYPPMGFKAACNSELTSFGPTVDALLQGRGIQPSSFGKDLDSVLDEFFDFCLEEDVPILTHCANSQTSFPEAGLRASPIYWKERLDATHPTRGTYGNLRVNLAHFGSAWCFSGEAPKSGDEAMRCNAVEHDGAGEWPRQIAELSKAYPNLYFDIADVGVLSKTSQGWMQLARYFQNILGSAANQVLLRMLYGTDWMFLSVAAATTYSDFAIGVDAFAKYLGAQPEDIFWKNSRRFLGLVPGAKTAKRLSDFYASDGQRKALLDAIIAG